MRTCEWCGVSIVSKRADAKFCSAAHRIYAHRASSSAGIPRQLTERNRWVRYTAGKRPITVNGDPASSTNPATWTTYEAANTSKAGIGIGYVLGEGIGCIDLDHCIIRGQLTKEAAAFLADYPRHYIEVSPSGQGLHIWGTADEGHGTRTVTNGLNIERYTTGRFITVTGNVHQAGQLLPL